MSDYWEDNGIEKPQQIIVCAAIKVETLRGEVLFCGARHCDKVMQAQSAAANISMKGGEQGFIDQFGDFLTREEALQMAKENGQPFNEKRNGGSTRLFSEGLY